MSGPKDKLAMNVVYFGPIGVLVILFSSLIDLRRSIG